MIYVQQEDGSCRCFESHTHVRRAPGRCYAFLPYCPEVYSRVKPVVEAAKYDAAHYFQKQEWKQTDAERHTFKRVDSDSGPGKW